jgi:pSer/pThr/pTyr-binding forkhead associated (FHA) protein
VKHKLVAIDGPLKGSTFFVSGEIFSIGRKSDNTLSPADPSISRHHCVIQCSGGQFRLTDRESQNGTFLNGIPIRERDLAHGDQIEVGASVFLFLVETPDNSSSGPTLFTETPPERIGACPRASYPEARKQVLGTPWEASSKRWACAASGSFRTKILILRMIAST